LDCRSALLQIKCTSRFKCQKMIWKIPNGHFLPNSWIKGRRHRYKGWVTESSWRVVFDSHCCRFVRQSICATQHNWLPRVIRKMILVLFQNHSVYPLLFPCCSIPSKLVILLITGCSKAIVTKKLDYSSTTC